MKTIWQHFSANRTGYIVTIIGGLAVVVLVAILGNYSSLKAWSYLTRYITVPIWLFFLPFILVSLYFLLVLLTKKLEENKPLEEVSGKQFGIEPVDVDGKRFIGCTFDGSNMIYSGKKPFALEHNKFINVKWTLDGSAGEALKFLSIMYREMGDVGKTGVEATFDRIKEGTYLKK